jgi:hypothetical protein
MTSAPIFTTASSATFSPTKEPTSAETTSILPVGSLARLVTVKSAAQAMTVADDKERKSLLREIEGAINRKPAFPDSRLSEINALVQPLKAAFSIEGALALQRLAEDWIKEYTPGATARAQAAVAALSATA